MNLKQAFNETRTENGDIAYNSSLNKYIDLIFKLVQYRKSPNLVNITLDSNNDYDIWFARVVRDCRYGFGEREVGRKLLAVAYPSGSAKSDIERREFMMRSNGAAYHFDVYDELVKEMILRYGNRFNITKKFN